MGILACGLHDVRFLRPYIAKFSLAFGFRNVFFLPMVILCRIVQLADQGEYQRSAVLLYAMPRFITRFADHPFPMGWSNRWQLFVRLRETLAARLGIDGLRAAEEHAQRFTSEEIEAETQALLDQLES
jgi:hypothetical protein